MRIAFSGAQGVGKTTLCLAVQGEIEQSGHSVTVITEIARDLARLGIGIDRQSTADEYCRFVSEYVRRRLLTESNYVIHDRTLLDCTSYIVANGNASAYFLEMMEWLTRWYVMDVDYYFYIPIEFPLVSDGVRPCDNAWQSAVDQRIHSYLDTLKINYATVTGDVAGRVQQVMGVLHAPGARHATAE